MTDHVFKPDSTEPSRRRFLREVGQRTVATGTTAAMLNGLGGAAALVLCLPLLVHSQTSVAVKASWESDYSQLRQKLGQKAVLAKTSASMARGAQALDKQALLWDSDNTPLDVQLRRTEALINHLETLAGSPDLSSIESELQGIKTRRNTMGLAKLSSEAAAAQDMALYIELRALTRQVAFANPVFDFDEIILTSTAQGGHYVGGYQGWQARAGGGLYKATNLKTNPVIFDILANSTVQNGCLRIGA